MRLPDTSPPGQFLRRVSSQDSSGSVNSYRLTAACELDRQGPTNNGIEQRESRLGRALGLFFLLYYHGVPQRP